MWTIRLLEYREQWGCYSVTYLKRDSSCSHGSSYSLAPVLTIMDTGWSWSMRLTSPASSSTTGEEDEVRGVAGADAGGEAGTSIGDDAPLGRRKPAFVLRSWTKLPPWPWAAARLLPKALIIVASSSRAPVDRGEPSDSLSAVRSFEVVPNSRRRRSFDPATCPLLASAVGALPVRVSDDSLPHGDRRSRLLSDVRRTHSGSSRPPATWFVLEALLTLPGGVMPNKNQRKWLGRK